jgi:hypothetical protein
MYSAVQWTWSFNVDSVLKIHNMFFLFKGTVYSYWLCDTENMFDCLPRTAAAGPSSKYLQRKIIYEKFFNWYDSF